MNLTQGSRNYALIKSIDTTNEYAHVKRLTVILGVCDNYTDYHIKKVQRPEQNNNTTT